MAGGGKDFTDFVIMVHGAGERLAFVSHLWSSEYKGPFKRREANRLQGQIHRMNGNKYVLNLDRATRIKWAPWKKINWKRPFWTLNELTRSKKIGLIRYQEPCDHKCSKCPDNNGDKCKTSLEVIEPIHISRTHQPSGRILDSAKPLDPKQKTPILTSWLSPYGLKMIVDSSPKYKKAYKSYAFGLLKKLGGKWMYLLIAGVVIIVLILYFTGYLSFGAR